ncbi:MAG: aldehyde dehydrogenase family protein [Nitriliruptorales bacterium]|nr:aldehyde dehydrogenase family protein [Nitriliruptorales bacterium]
MSGTLLIPEAEHAIPASTTAQIDAALDELESRRKDWVALGIPERIALLDACIAGVMAEAEAWAETDCLVKGIPEDSPLRGEGWVTGPVPTVFNLRALKLTLEQILETGRPQPPGFRTHANGQTVVDVFPVNIWHKLAFQGFSHEVRLQPGVSIEEAQERMARIYRGEKDDGGISLVLGAGNVGSIAPTDALYKLFVEDRVVILKMNPVNERIGPHLERALSPLIIDGYLRIVYGGGEEGAYLCQHNLVSDIHITGSDKTHDLIVFGPGKEGAKRKKNNDPVLDKPISSELGNVTPIIVVPGPWSNRDINFHGDNIASMLAQNAGFNCVAGRVIVTHRSWSSRTPLLNAVRDSLRRAEPRQPYYPGAADRWQQYLDAHPEAETFGPMGEGRVPFTLIPDLDASASDEIAFDTESFCGVFAEVGLDAPTSVPDYLAKAVDFANERLWGQLAATIIVHPRSLKDPEVARAVEQAIDNLEYGNIVVNHWAGIAFGMVTASWGSHPGNELNDIGSGIGIVHNSFMLSDVQKGVLRGPFRSPLTPPWFHTNKQLHRIGPRFFRYMATDDPKELAGLVGLSVLG